MAEKTTTQFWVMTISPGQCMEGGKIVAYWKQQLWNALKVKNILENEIPYYAVCLSKKSAQEILVYTNMVEIFKTVGIDYLQGPEKGVGYQCFS